jgi:2-oxoglutarate dehydrogenase E2 component (dihydrolipoamide succinyltransferase)
MKIAANLKEA